MESMFSLFSRLLIDVQNSKDMKRWRLRQASILEAAPILSKKIMKDHENQQQSAKKPRFNN